MPYKNGTWRCFIIKVSIRHIQAPGSSWNIYEMPSWYKYEEKYSWDVAFFYTWIHTRLNISLSLVQQHKTKWLQVISFRLKHLSDNIIASTIQVWVPEVILTINGPLCVSKSGMPYKNGTWRCFIIKVSIRCGLKLEGKADEEKGYKVTSKDTRHDIKTWCMKNAAE